MEMSDFKQLAMVWLQQQDLSNKSVCEVAEMYHFALSQLRDKYPSSQSQTKSRRVIHPGIKSDEW